MNEPITSTTAGTKVTARVWKNGEMPPPHVQAAFDAERERRMEEKINLEMRDTPINEGMWAAFVKFAIGNDEFHEAFAAATGLRYSPANSTMDAMVDKATGYAAHFTREFVYWVTEHHWGTECAPQKIREKIERRRRLDGREVT